MLLYYYHYKNNYIIINIIIKIMTEIYLSKNPKAY